MRILRALVVIASLAAATTASAQRPVRTEKPPLHAKHWLAITGKPLSATAGALMFAKGGNAVDAAAAMLAAGCTMWDTLSCGGSAEHKQLPDALTVRRSRVAPGLHTRRELDAGQRTHGATRAGRSSSRSGRRAPSTSYCSTGNTAPCGAGRATTARITASPGDRAAVLGANSVKNELNRSNRRKRTRLPRTTN